MMGFRNIPRTIFYLPNRWKYREDNIYQLYARSFKLLFIIIKEGTKCYQIIARRTELDLRMASVGSSAAFPVERQT